jgi:dipeptidyl aminopeptidase/acylaminoacyl peptidase
MMLRYLQIITQVMALIISCRLCTAAESRELSVQDALNVNSLSSVSPITLSPDGKLLVYTTRQNRQTITTDSQEQERCTGVSWYGKSSQLSLLYTDTGQTLDLTHGKGSNWLPAWSPDGRYVAFLSDRDDSHQARLWVWDVRGQTLRRVSSLDIRASSFLYTGQIQWTPDSQRVLIAVRTDRDSDGVAAQNCSLDQPDINDSASKISVYQASATHDPGNSDAWNLDESVRDLAIIDVNTAETKIIVRHRRIGTYLLSPDGSQLAFTSPVRFEKPGSQQILFDLATVSLATANQDVLASGLRLDYGGGHFTWSPDSAHIAYIAFGQGETLNDLFITDSTLPSVRNLTKFDAPPTNPSDGPQRPLWDKQSKHIYFVRGGELWLASIDGEPTRELARVQDRTIISLISGSGASLWKCCRSDSTIVTTHDDTGKQDGFYEIDLNTGKASKRLEGGQCFTCAFIGELPVSQKQIFYAAEDGQHPQDLWTINLGSGTPRQLTRLNPHLSDLNMGRPQLIHWLSDDGEALQGALLLPPDHTEGGRFPLIVLVYGGASLSNNFDQFGFAFGAPFDMQLFATRGYAVLLPDAPFHHQTPMLDLVKTVLPGISKLVEMGIADPDRIGVMGHSNGAYSSLALITQTSRFKAAIAIDGTGDLVGLYGEMDQSGATFGMSTLERLGSLGATLWQNREKYVENSPLFYLDQTQTPVLIIHGDADSTVAPFLGDEIFVALRRLGKQVEYAKYHGENHGPMGWSFDNQVDLCNRMVAWFDKYLKHQSPQNHQP